MTMNRSARHLSLALVALVFLAAVAALSSCASSDDEQVVRIGATVSKTGRYAAEGEHTRQGYRLWEEWVNGEYGGIRVGARRYHVELVIYDDRSETDTTAALVEQLIDADGVDFLLGPYSSTLTKSAIDVAEDRSVILVEGNGASESLFQQSFENLFAVLTPAGNYARTALQALAERGAKSVAIAHVDALFPASVTAGARRWAEEYGLKVLGVETYPQDVADVTDIVRRFKALNPDVFLGGVYFGDALKFVRAAKALDFSPKAMVLTVGPTNPQFTEDLGADANYLMGPTQWQASMDYRGDHFGSASDYAERFEDRWGTTPAYQSASATAAALALQLAIEAAGSLDTDAVRSALRKLDVDTFYGPISFDATGKNAARPMGTIQIQQGVIRVVAPVGAAVAELAYPAPSWKDR